MVLYTVYEIKGSKVLPFNFVSFYCNFQLKKRDEQLVLEAFQCQRNINNRVVLLHFMFCK
jgi:hypothetical protein